METTNNTSAPDDTETHYTRTPAQAAAYHAGAVWCQRGYGLWSRVAFRGDVGAVLARVDNRYDSARWRWYTPSTKTQPACAGWQSDRRAAQAYADACLAGAAGWERFVMPRIF